MPLFTADYRALAQVEGFIPEMEAADYADFELAAMNWVRDHYEFASDVEILNVTEVIA